VIAIVVAAVVICAGAGVAILVGNMEPVEKGVTEGVNYHGNGGKTSSGGTLVGSLIHEVLDGSMFTKGNDTFLSWNTKADGSGDTYRYEEYIAFASGESVDLYAIWAAHALVFSGGDLNYNLGIYYDNAKVSAKNPVAIPASGPIDVVLKPVSDATDLQVKKYTDEGKITLDVSFKVGTGNTTYTYSTYVKADGENIDFEWKEVDGNVVMTIDYDNNYVLDINYRYGTSISS